MGANCTLKLNMGRSPGYEFFHSPQWRGRGFANVLPKAPLEYSKILKRLASGRSPHSAPREEVPICQRRGFEFRQAPASGLRVTWLGHSSSLVEIEGKRILLDPVWGLRASPFNSVGVKRFHPPPLPLNELPKLDAVLISHDHYDHLDRSTVEALAQRRLVWLVPLGVGSHLEYWGVSRNRIREFDWWQSLQLGNTTLTCVPARHDSGRSIFFNDRQSTLWCGWAIQGQQRSLFYSGDSGMHEGFQQVGERLGPFDISLVEIGAYDALWKDHHMGPEQAVQAHTMVRAKLMLPVHWATFELAPHSWTEPIERLMVAAREHEAAVTLPRPGESVEPDQPLRHQKWWPTLPWRDARSYPIQSSLVGHLLT